MKEENFDRIILIFLFICTIFYLAATWTTYPTPKIVDYIPLIAGIIMLILFLRGLIKKRIMVNIKKYSDYNKNFKDYVIGLLLFLITSIILIYQSFKLIYLYS